MMMGEKQDERWGRATTLITQGFMCVDWIFSYEPNCTDSCRLLRESRHEFKLESQYMQAIVYLLRKLGDKLGLVKMSIIYILALVSRNIMGTI